MDALLVDLVWRRAQARCESCRVPQEFDALPFHIDHILPRKHGGLTLADNLALACYQCNVFKGANLTGIDPQSGAICQLIHPRQHDWPAHFEWNGAELVGRTDMGRTTVRVLEINLPARVNHRAGLIAEGIVL